MKTFVLDVLDNDELLSLRFFLDNDEKLYMRFVLDNDE